jgi:hypothetical protein
VELIFESFKRIFLCAPDIEAAVVGGSLGRGEEHEYSDIDFFLLISKNDMSLFLLQEMVEIASMLDEPLLFRGPVYVPEFGYSFTILYDNYPVVQVNVNNRGTLVRNAMVGERKVILFDRTGYYTDFIKSCEGLSLDKKKIFSQAFNFFWLRALSVVKDLQRGELWLAIRHMSDIRDQIVIVKRLVRNIPPTGLNFNIPTKSLESELENESSSLVLSQCGYSIGSISDSLMFCVREFMKDISFYALTLSEEGRKAISISSQLSLRIADELGKI